MAKRRAQRPNRRQNTSLKVMLAMGKLAPPLVVLEKG